MTELSPFRLLVYTMALFAAGHAAACSGCWREEGDEAGFVTCIRKRPMPTNRCACSGSSLVTVDEKTGGGGNRATMYSGAWIAPWKVFETAPWSRTGPLEWASWHAFGRAEGGIFRTSDQRGLWLHHLSAYEHSVVPRFENGMELVRRVAEAEVRDACNVVDTFSWPLKASTVAVVPFYGGQLSRDTGNAHSRQPLQVKLLGLVANVCSLVSSFASLVVVAACEGEDARVVRDRFSHHIANKSVKIFEVVCKAPAHLPFNALAGLATFLGETNKTIVAYTEADQVLRWGSPEAANSTALFMNDFEMTLVTPHRWHKRYGSKPECGAFCGMSITGQNLCHSRSANVDRKYFPHK